MIYIYRRKGSESADDLAEALDARRIRRPQNHRFQDGDVIVCWGEEAPGPDYPAKVRFLNGHVLMSKMSDALTLKKAGIATIEVSKTKPRDFIQIDPAEEIFEELTESAGVIRDASFDRSNPAMIRTLEEFQQLITQYRDVISRPLPPATPVEWLGRYTDHQGGTDLITPPSDPNYWVKKETLVNEYRVHSFQGQSIRDGYKIHRYNYRNPSPWIRSWDAGWRMCYEKGHVSTVMKDLAHAAVKALKLDFGAVDIGERPDKSLIVLEVNRAPGLDDEGFLKPTGKTVKAYAEAIKAAIAAGRVA